MPSEHVLDTPNYDGTLGARAALAALKPVVADYATTSIASGFNWDETLALIATIDWFLVVFRSIRRADADSDLLTTLDNQAHDEALSAPGFLYYFKGSLGDRRECLSFCLWEGAAAAWAASRQARHSTAASIVDVMYESYRLERFLVRKSGHQTYVRFERAVNPAIPAWEV
jgi:hypothetical protein